MADSVKDLLEDRLDADNLKKLLALGSPKMHAFIAEAIELTRPESVFVCDDSNTDLAYIRSFAIESGEERSLAIEGHTSHFDGFYDQARDKANTKYLLEPGTDLGASLNSTGKEAGTKEVLAFLKDSMVGKQMIVWESAMRGKMQERSAYPGTPFLMAVQISVRSLGAKVRRCW